MINQFKVIVLTVLVIVFNSCSKEYNEPSSTVSNPLDYYVSLEDVKELEKKISESTKDYRKISSIQEIKGAGNLSDMYYVYYRDGGAQFISADKRTPVLLAQLDEAPKDYSKMLENPGIKFWIEHMEDNYRALREHPLNPEIELKSEKWSNEINQTLLVSVDMNGTFVNLHSTEGEKRVLGNMMNIMWDQRDDYNNHLEGNCSGDQYPAGCNTIAVASILKYHSQSTSNIHYNWSNMPNNSATTETAKLIRKVFDLIPNTRVTCSETSAIPYFVKNVMKNNGFPDAVINPIHWYDIVDDINNNLPVIIYGGSDWWSGHTWVCQGYSDNYQSRYHMNWGWGGDHNNWYYLGEFNPGSSSFNTNVEAITNLEPNRFPLSTRTVTMKSNNGWGRYLCSENGNIWAVANRPEAKDWEKLEFLKNYDGTYSIRGNNGLYADIDRSAGHYVKFNQWDRYNADCKFIITRVGDDIYTIKSAHTGLYLSSENGNSNGVRCNRTNAYFWEKWEIK